MGEVNWTEYMLNELKKNNRVDLVAVTQKRFGNTEKLNLKKTYNLFYFNRSRWTETLGPLLISSNIVSVVNNAVVVHPTSAPLPPRTGQRKPYAPRTHKDKTAVLIIREKTTDGVVGYEVETLGDVNRNMMKEALKQLMEAFI